SDFSIAHNVVWPKRYPVSVIPVVFLLSVVVLVVFVRLQLTNARAQRDSLFHFEDFRYKTYRYGMATTMVLAMGQLGISFVLPVFLQNAKHLTAARHGVWMLPAGLLIIVGSQIGGLLIGRHGAVLSVRIGPLLYACRIV